MGGCVCLGKEVGWQKRARRHEFLPRTCLPSHQCSSISLCLEVIQITKQTLSCLAIESAMAVKIFGLTTDRTIVPCQCKGECKRRE